MIKNGKYYLPPEEVGADFKELFGRLTASGAGRPVDEDGFASGPWTADLLAEAISDIHSNENGIDLRTVQLWFQNNDKGVSPENIRWLARVFGCDDPDATNAWQLELSAALTRFMARRRERKRLGLDDEALPLDTPPQTPVDNKAVVKRWWFNLARISEGLFSRRSPLDLPIVVFAGAVTLGLLAYVTGVHNVTYSPVAGLTKQVGFLWAPSWTFEGLVLLPLFLIVVTGLLAFWKHERLSTPTLRVAEARGDDGWMRKVESFSTAFWVILLACLLIVCVLQWTATYLSAFMEGATKNAMVDWLLVAVVRPDVISIPEAFAISIIAFLYSGMIYWFYLVGLLLLYMVANDFYETCYAPDEQSSEAHRLKTLEIGIEMMRAIFRCTVFGVLIAMCIKLNTAYLLSDGANIVSWLVNDALSVFGLRDGEAGWLDASALPYFTSVLLVMLTSFVFFASLTQIYWVLGQPSTSDDASSSDGERQIESLINRTKVSWYKMIAVVVLLVVSFLLIGQFMGFSILLVGSVLVATYSLFQRRG